MSTRARALTKIATACELAAAGRDLFVGELAIKGAIDNGTRHVEVIATLDGHGVLDYATGPGPSGSLTLEYGPRASSPQDLHLDLSGDGATAFTTDLVGDLDASRGRTVALTVTVRSGTTTASCTRTLGADGLVRVPFSCFSPAIAFTRIDYVKLVFDASAQWGIDFDLVGGIATAGSPR